MSDNITKPTPVDTEFAQPPAHHLHDSAEVLPGARGARAAPNYAADTMQQAPSSAFSPQAQEDSSRYSQGQGQNAYNTERPMDVQPTSAGGVAVGGRSDLPEGHASLGDKIIGKTQKVAGKYTHNPEMHEKGELRESGGKDAARGLARAPHD
ncbi:hypothetical protein FISHEDRAFT_43141 [Fistulina hepatica ATCC 64428]|uniref:Uncharacterized protein n=1 Tax=Fistulina hepatica ATCC 64428 TaxID=1128425 RepID=A0A0D7ACK9_9AGAR|nr:hypothetical protein FISHEDRAFT_43141 [Fistulina hepatica ATCC 64428]